VCRCAWSRIIVTGLDVVIIAGGQVNKPLPTCWCVLHDNIMNEDLKQLSILFKTNTLSPKIDKTNYIIFTISKTTIINDYKLNTDEKQINRADVTKFLVIHIDSKLQ